MTREQRFRQLEELCQQRYAIIDNCYRMIESAQKDLAKLEVKYLRAKAAYENITSKPPTVRTSKINKLRMSLESLGLTSADIADLLNKGKK